MQKFIPNHNNMMSADEICKCVGVPPTWVNKRKELLSLFTEYDNPLTPEKKYKTSDVNELIDSFQPID